MGSAPRISLCLPTSPGRESFLKVSLASAIKEALAHPPGTVEVLVSDNGCPELTNALLEEFQRQHPRLRRVGFQENQGFDRNYLNCIQEATGDFVWILGDDDMFLPGCVARVLEAVDAGADAILCGAFECDLQMKPLQPRGWFKEATPPTVWHIDGRQDLIDYFGKLQYEAGAFGFISAAIIRRGRYLEKLEETRQGIGTGFVHVLGMMLFMAAPTCLHWIPQPLFLNRLGNDGLAGRDPFGRWMVDLAAWVNIANICFPGRDALRMAFMSVLRSNHGDQMVRGMRIAAGSDRAKWAEAEWQLIEVGFDPRLVHGVDLAHHILMLEVRCPRGLDPEGLCLADLPMVTRGARRIAVLAAVDLDEFLAATPLLEAIRSGTRAAIRVVCLPELVGLLDGFDLQLLDPQRRDEVYLDGQARAIREFAPDLVVNLDRQRRALGDLLAAAAGAAGVLGFDNETAENHNDAERLRRGHAYRRLVPPQASFKDLAAALGLQPGPERLWFDQARLDQAQAILAQAGCKPGRALAVLGDDEAGLVSGAPWLAQAYREGWTAIGLGSQGTQAPLGQALKPLGARAVNLGGAHSLATMASILNACGASLGGSRTFQNLARVAGCPPLGPLAAD